MRLRVIIILCLLCSLLLNATLPEKNKDGGCLYANKKSGLVELRFPTLYFKKNSTDYVGEIWEGDTLKAEATLDRVAEMINHEKDLVVEVGGRCSADEKDAKSLSLKRARKVVSDLLKRGVQKKRMTAKGYGANAPKYTEAEIAEAKTGKQEILRAQNRRCVFGILKWEEK